MKLAIMQLSVAGLLAALFTVTFTVIAALGMGSGSDALPGETGVSPHYDYRYSQAAEGLGLSSIGALDSKMSLGSIPTANLTTNDTMEGKKRKILLDDDDEASSRSHGGPTVCGEIPICANTCNRTCGETCGNTYDDTYGSTCISTYGYICGTVPTCVNTCMETCGRTCSMTCDDARVPMYTHIPVPVISVTVAPPAKTYAAPSPAEHNSLSPYDTMAKPPAYVRYNGVNMPWTSFSQQFIGDALLTWIEMADNSWGVIATTPQGTWIRELVYVPRAGDLNVSKTYASNALNTCYSSAVPGYKYIWLYADRKGTYTTVFSMGGRAGNSVTFYA